MDYKKGRILLFFFFAFPFFSPYFASAVEPWVRKELKLTLKDGISMVLENNLDIIIQRIFPQIEEARIQRERGIFDVEAFGTFKREDSETPLNTRSTVAAGGLVSVESETYSLNSGITGKSPIGTEYTLEFKDDWVANTFNDFEFEYNSFAGVRVTQPLLKNFGTEANRVNINIARKNREISGHRLKQRVIDSVAGYESAYWDLVRAKEEIEVRKESLRLAQSLLDLNRKKLEAGAISPLEVTQAEAGAASRKEEVIVAQKNVREKENALKLLISADVYLLKDTEILPLDRPAVTPIRPGLEESVKTAFEARPDFIEAKTEIEKRNIRVNFAENQSFPRVDLEASYGYNGLGTSFGDSVDELWNNPQWTVGVTLRYPIGNNTARGDLRVARMEAREALLRLKKLEQEIIVKVDNAIKELNAGEERVQATRTSTRLAEEALKAEELKLKAGLSTTFNVLKLQEDLTKARTSEIAAIIDYNKAFSAFLKEKGTILEEKGINFIGESYAGEAEKSAAR